MQRKQLWYTLGEEEGGPSLVALAGKYRMQFTSRKTRAVNLLSLYEGLSLGRFSADAYDDAGPLELWGNDATDEDDSPVDVVWNVGASIMDSIDAKLFALDRIKTQFVVTDGGWEAKRAAIMASRFIEGQMSEPQGIFPNLWAMWRHAARLAETSTGAAAVFFWPDQEAGRIVAELDDTLNMFVETSGLPYDGITSIGRVTYWDPDKLAAKYPEHEQAIFSAAETPDHELTPEDDTDAPPEEVQRVPLVQGWRMKAPGVKGMYCAAIPGATLEWEEYKCDEPPCVFYIPMRQLAGFWGRTRLERIVRPLQRLNEVLAAVDDAERLTPKGVVWYDPTTTDNTQLETVKNVVLIPHTGPMDRKPVYEPPAPFHPLQLELLKLHRDACFDLTGMSEAHVTASRERGLSSGVAIRLVQDQVYERFAPTEEEFSRCVGEASARQMIRCIKQMGSFKSTWKSAEKGGFLAEIPSEVFNILDKYKYKAEPYAVSGNINTPADRVELAEKLMGSGVITGEAYAAILQHFDVPGQADAGIGKVEEQFVAKQVDLWLFGELKEMPKRYMGPEKWMQLEQRLLQVGAAYLEAKMEMCGGLNDPEVIDRLGYFFRFISELEALIEQKKQREAELAATAQAAAPPPPAGPMPGGPPMMAPPPPMM